MLLEEEDELVVDAEGGVIGVSGSSSD